MADSKPVEVDGSLSMGFDRLWLKLLKNNRKL